VKLQILSSFGLDQAEVLLDEYKCNYMRAVVPGTLVPVQGRLYITQYHVCFYSNLLNVEHRMVFRAKDIIAIHRRDDRTVTLSLLAAATKRRGEVRLLAQEHASNTRVRCCRYGGVSSVCVGRRPCVVAGVVSDARQAQRLLLFMALQTPRRMIRDET
jgi:hypothetical protein